MIRKKCIFIKLILYLKFQLRTSYEQGVKIFKMGTGYDNGVTTNLNALPERIV